MHHIVYSRVCTGIDTSKPLDQCFGGNSAMESGVGTVINCPRLFLL